MVECGECSKDSTNPFSSSAASYLINGKVLTFDFMHNSKTFGTFDISDMEQAWRITIDNRTTTRAFGSAVVTVYIVPHGFEMIKTAKVLGEVASDVALGIALFTPIAQMGPQQNLAAISHVCATKSQETVKKSISKVMAPLMVPGIASPDLSALLGNFIILASVFILCFAIHKAAPQIVRDYITWPRYLWQALSFLHMGTIFHSVHLVINSEDVGLKILGVLVTLLYGVAGPFDMWR